MACAVLGWGGRSILKVSEMARYKHWLCVELRQGCSLEGCCISFPLPIQTQLYEVGIIILNIQM